MWNYMVNYADKFELWIELRSEKWLDVIYKDIKWYTMYKFDGIYRWFVWFYDFCRNHKYIGI